MPDRLRPVRLWLWLVAALVVLMVAVGGATRLTGSGLAITEWRPVTGAVPPLSEEAWRAEFEKYRRISQYELVNKGMTLDAFRSIYWWEWGHRQLGRVIGLVYAFGFAWAVTGRRVDRISGLLLLGAGLLLGTQGAVGWIMVASGLEPGMTAVAPVKLALHLGLACLFLGSVLLLLLRFGAFPADRHRAPLEVRTAAYSLAALVSLQILLGGLVAGSGAGLAFNTWPLMDGRLIPSPDALFAVSPWALNFIENADLVQFNHRLAAYLLLAVAAWHALAAARRMPGSAAALRAQALVLLVIAQAGIGVATLIYAVPLALGLAHQMGAVLLLGLALVHAGIVGRTQSSGAPARFAEPALGPAE